MRLTSWTIYVGPIWMRLPLTDITPDGKNNWLNQSNSDFDRLMPLADRQTKLAKTAGGEQAVFKLYSLGVNTARDEWVYDFDTRNLREKARLLC